MIIKPESFDSRKIIRETWARKAIQNSTTFRVLFVVGQSKTNQINDQIIEEFNRHGDIIQEDYLDSYFNITIKVKWMRDYCPRVRFVLRINDHMQVNIFSLINYLRGLHVSQQVYKNGTNTSILVRK